MDYSSIVERIKPSIALIVNFNNKGQISSTGSGFVFSKNGILATCNHVVEQDAAIKIRFSDDETLLDAKVVIRDEEHDLALLKFSDETRQPIPQAEISSVKEGMSVLFSGYPLRIFNLTTHQGILSAIIKDATGITTFLIDGTVNSGNSGCPLMNDKGEVIGIVNAKQRESSDTLTKVEEMTTGAVSLYGVDLINIYQALISNVQLGIGYAVPCSYMPKHHEPKIVDVTKDIMEKTKNEDVNKGVIPKK